MNELELLKLRVDQLEKQLLKNNELFDNFSSKVVFNKQVQFKANVYDASGGIVAEINNL